MATKVPSRRTRLYLGGLPLMLPVFGGRHLVVILNIYYYWYGNLLFEQRG